TGSGQRIGSSLVHLGGRNPARSCRSALAARSNATPTTIAAASMAFANQVLDKTYMSRMSDFIDVLHNQNKPESWFYRRGAACEPAIAGEVRRQVDPYMRWTAGFVDELRNRTPGLSESLPLARDMRGRPRIYQSGLI